MKKNLVYLACFLGKHPEIYKLMLNTCVWSLRTKGRYFGDIVVLKNVPDSLMQSAIADNVQEVCVPSDRDYGFSGSQLERARGKHYKFILNEFIDCQSYDNILFLDIDIIAIRNVNQLFMIDDVELSFVVEDSPMSAGSFNHYFGPEDLKKAEQRKGANSGTFCVKGDAYVKFVDLWKSNFNLPMINPGYEWDQPPLNNLLFKNELPNKAYHHRTVYFPLLYSHNYGEETLLYHFNSKGQKEKDFNVMRSYIDLLGWHSDHEI